MFAFKNFYFISFQNVEVFQMETEMVQPKEVFELTRLELARYDCIQSFFNCFEIESGR